MSLIYDIEEPTKRVFTIQFFLINQYQQKETFLTKKTVTHKIEEVISLDLQMLLIL